MPKSVILIGSIINTISTTEIPIMIKLSNFGYVTLLIINKDTIVINIKAI